MFKIPGEKTPSPLWVFYLFVCLCLFWIGNHVTYLMVKVFVSSTWIFLEWLNPYSIYHLFPWYIAIPSYKDWTSPNTILLFILATILDIRYFDNPGVCFHIEEVSWFTMFCIRWLRMRKYCWTGLSKLNIVSLIQESSFVIIEYETDVKKKGIRIMCCIICVHYYVTMYNGEKFRINLCMNF